MALSFSTGLKNALLDTGDLKTLLDDGLIRIYSGAVPANADAALGAAVLLNEYSDADQGAGAGQGLDFAASASGGAISKAPAQVWSGTSEVAGGVATFFRFVQQADDGTASSTQIRLQGSVGGAGAELFVQSTTFAGSTLYTIDFFSVSIPL